jgi:hypothetical protein|tara:strand:- start:2179 stop:2946 length:768 start_codon:yes stop_codon:yes gene_type:complete
MNRKILFLFSILSLICASCSISQKITNLQNPPVDYFVKIFKDLEVTRCSKKDNSCETKKFISTGSGLVIRISSLFQNVVLSAGHVCTEDGLIPENEKYKFSWVETIRVLDRNKNFHDGHVILSQQASGKASDLCSIYVPTLDYFKYKSNISISDSKPKIGEKIYYIGAPLGIHHPPTALIIDGIFSGEIDEFSSLTSLRAAPGASGSVVLSNRNKIYGVLFAVHPNFQSATIITNHSKTKDFILKTKQALIAQPN